MKHILSGQQQQIDQAYKALGVRFNSAPSTRELLGKWIKWFTQPYQEKIWDCKKHPNYMAEGLKLWNQLRANCLQYNPDLIFLDRTWMGNYRLIERMGAKVSFLETRTLLWA